MISYWLYDDRRNIAVQQNVDLDEVHFMRSAEHNFFLVKEEYQFITVQGTNSESMTMKDVTSEQAVILFATLRGLKEAAREE